MKIWMTVEIEDKDAQDIDVKMKSVRKLLDNIANMGFPYSLKITTMKRDITKDFHR